MCKKIFALLLAMLMVVSLAACDLGSVSGNQTKKEFTLGTITGSKYENSFIGIGCQLPAGWSVMSQEEMKAQNELTMSMIGDDYANAIKNATIIYELFATHENMTDTVNVNMEKLTGVNASLTEDAYAKLSMDGLKSALESMGITNLTATVDKITFAGKEHACINVSGEFMGIAIYEKVINVKCDGYMSNISVCTWQTDGCNEILSCFYGV